MSKVNKRVFEADLGDNKKGRLAVKRPDQKALREAQKVHNKAFRDAVESGALLRAGIEKVMRAQNLWDDARQKEFEGIQKRLSDGEKKLAGGRIKLSEARSIALDMASARASLRDILSERNNLDLHTAEAQAENARFGFLVSACTFIESEGGKPFFRDYDDYLSRADEPASGQAASELGKLLYSLEDDWQKKLPEWAFMLRMRLCDDKLRLTSRETGKFVDARGRPVDEEGYLVNEEGHRVSEDGTPLNEDGTFAVEFSPFLDEDGNPILETQETEALPLTV